MTVQELMERLQKIMKFISRDAKVETGFFDEDGELCEGRCVNNVLRAKKENGEMIIVIETEAEDEAEDEDEGPGAVVEDVLTDATRQSEELRAKMRADRAAKAKKGAEAGTGSETGEESGTDIPGRDEPPRIRPVKPERPKREDVMTM